MDLDRLVDQAICAVYDQTDKPRADHWTHEDAEQIYTRVLVELGRLGLPTGASLPSKDEVRKRWRNLGRSPTRRAKLKSLAI